MIDHITHEAEENVSAVISEAKSSAAAMTAENEKKIEEECSRIARKADSEAENIAERSVASAQLKARQILLSGRQELINSTLEAARERLGNMDEAEYFPLLLKLFKKHCPAKDASISFCSRDMERMPDPLKEEIRKAAAEKGCGLRFSETPADIQNGFVLDFGGVEENCSFDALMENSIDDLRDLIQRILFA